MKTSYQILRDKVKMNNFTFVEQEAICAAMEEYSAQFNKPPVYGQWIDVKKRLPNVGQRVIWKGVLKWQSKPNDVSYFDDELTGETEALEYGGIGYRLKDNSDYLAIPHDTDYCDEILVEWQPLPPSPGSVDVEEKQDTAFLLAVKKKMPLSERLNTVSEKLKSVKEVSREGENQTEDGKDIILRVAMELGAVFQVQFVEDDGNTWTTPVNLTPERLKRLDDISIRKIRIEFKP